MSLSHDRHDDRRSIRHRIHDNDSENVHSCLHGRHMQHRALLLTQFQSINDVQHKRKSITICITMAKCINYVIYIIESRV